MFPGLPLFPIPGGRITDPISDIYIVKYFDVVGKMS